MVAPLSAWPWENFGNLKYLLYTPLAAQVVYSWTHEKDYTRALWCLHILIISGLKGLLHVFWSSFTNMLFLTRSLRINPKGVDFKQIDHEWHWDNYILLQAMIASMICCMSPSLMVMKSLPLWNTKGLIVLIVLHVTFSEPLYYFLHRCSHRYNYFFAHYHSYHHSSPVLHPMTAGNAKLFESLIMCVVAGVPLIGSCLLGVGSMSLIYGYAIAFDFMRCLGHCNVEIFPHKLFETLPFLRYLIYTPTYHSLHHQEMGTNFCLFMPLFDVLGNTLNPDSWVLHRKIRLGAGEKKRVPEFVFLVHGVDVMSSMHMQFVFRSFTSMPYTTRLFLLPFWPFSLFLILGAWVLSSKTFLLSFYTIRNNLCELWSVPRVGFQYFLPFAKQGINNHIEGAILSADEIGAKVISLAALNKNESLNGGGTLFVNKHPDLRVRVVHGNTLTAAVILNEIPKDAKEVFLTGATSKLGRAIALYLCRRGVKVLMLTLSKERFEKVQQEASVECQNYLVQVTKYNAAQHCKTWIVGKWLTPREQSWAPAGTHFHQFVIPPILKFRRNCTYGDLAGMRLPKDVQGLGSCEYIMERGVVHACHAGGLVHMLEGWEHHEVGAIDVDRIDLVWEAALRHGLSSVSSLTN